MAPAGLAATGLRAPGAGDLTEADNIIITVPTSCVACDPLSSERK